ncbi:MAG: hypothetical protein AAFX93_02950 [Verrucomicrobiota bacterium]
MSLDIEKVKDHIAIVTFLVMLGAGLGYLYGAGAFDLARSSIEKSRISRENYRDRAFTPVSREEYLSDVRRSTLIGTGLGLGLAVYFIAKPIRKNPDSR